VLTGFAGVVIKSKKGLLTDLCDIINFIFDLTYSNLFLSALAHANPYKKVHNVVLQIRFLPNLY